MRYLKTYEDNLQNLIPGNYIIFTANSGWVEDQYYMMGQIDSIDNGLQVKIIDNIPYHSEHIKNHTVFVDNFRSVFVSSSLEKAKKEFEKFEKELVIKKDAKKYNL